MFRIVIKGGIVLDNPIALPIFGEGFTIDVPRHIPIFEGFNLYLYALCITLGFVLAALYVFKRRDIFGLSKDNVLDLVILAVPFGLIGARLYYVIFNPSQYFGAGNWQNIFMLREGGLAIYGGIIGAAIAFLVYSKIKKIRLTTLVDAAAFGLFIGQSIGRWGNFFNREAYGIPTDLPWRMGIMTSASEGYGYFHPIFLYESLWNVLGLVLLHIFSKKRKSGYPGQYFLIYVAWYGFGRFFIEGIRGPDVLLIHGTDIRVSQLIAALSCLAALTFLIIMHLKTRRPNLDVENLIMKNSSIDDDLEVSGGKDPIDTDDGASSGEAPGGKDPVDADDGASGEALGGKGPVDADEDGSDSPKEDAGSGIAAEDAQETLNKERNGE